MEGKNMEMGTNAKQSLEGRAEEIGGVVEQMIDRMDMRYRLKGLHGAINEMLRKVADEHGFTCVPGSLRYDGISVTGRMTFVLKGKESEMATRAAGASNCGLNVGDVVIGKGRPTAQYRVAGFGRVNVKLERISDGQGFLANPRLLERVGQPGST